MSLIILVSLTTLDLAEVEVLTLDKVCTSAKIKGEIGLKDTAEGLTYVCFLGGKGPTIVGRDQATRYKRLFQENYNYFSSLKPFIYYGKGQDQVGWILAKLGN